MELEVQPAEHETRTTGFEKGVDSISLYTIAQNWALPCYDNSVVNTDKQKSVDQP